MYRRTCFEYNFYIVKKKIFFWDRIACFTSKIVLKLLCTPLVDELLTWIWNHAIAIGTIIIKTFFNHEHWKHFQCFHRNICTVVKNVFLLISIILIFAVFLLFFFLFNCLLSFRWLVWSFELNFYFLLFYSMFCFCKKQCTLHLFTFNIHIPFSCLTQFNQWCLTSSKSNSVRKYYAITMVRYHRVSYVLNLSL